MTYPLSPDFYIKTAGETVSDSTMKMCKCVAKIINAAYFDGLEGRPRDSVFSLDIGRARLEILALKAALDGATSNAWEQGRREREDHNNG